MLVVGLLGMLIGLQIEPTPRLREALPNGAKIIAEYMPGSEYVCLQMFASCQGEPACTETPETRGWRHLLEHLMVKGQGKDLDKRLERQGIFLTAGTMRDALRIEVSCRPAQFGDVLQVMKELLQTPKISGEEIDAEVKTIEEENALLDASQRAGMSAWARVYGDRRLDPGGTADSISRATSEELAELHGRLFAPSNLVLAIAGPIKAEEALAVSRKVLLELPPGAVSVGPTKPAQKPPEAQTLITEGYVVRAVPVQSIANDEALWRLAAGLALASQDGSMRFIYTPSSSDGLMMLMSHDDLRFKRLTSEPLQQPIGEIARIGRMLAKSWIASNLKEPERAAYFRGLLLSLNVASRPEQLIERLDGMSEQQFVQGLGAYLGKDGTR